MSLCGTVLILVVVEDVLVHVKCRVSSQTMRVLILVVVEDVLVLISLVMMVVGELCLNPCCGGRCSSTRQSACAPSGAQRS